MEALSDARTMTWRNLKGMSRNPQVILFSTFQPVIFVLTFRYVFGGSIRIPGVDYVNFLMPGVFVQSVAFGGMNTAAGLADDLSKGMIERFRSLPMARSAVLAGRVLADLTRNLGVVLLMVGVGFLVGFRIEGTPAQFALALALIVAFAFGISFVFALIGLVASNAEAAQALGFPILAIMVFASTAFVPIAGMPGWLQAYNKVQPVSVTVAAVRGLTLGTATTSQILAALVWAIVLAAFFGPLAVRVYRRAK
ncbi:MAG TPA: ABC transporter permease [Acidimicrobiales bacterium]|nr:ABC transporter permease [Acidimicrobiales bacterium]